MTDKKTEALRMAREALKESHPEAYRHTITAIDEALAEQPAQPCGYPYCGCNSKAWCKVEQPAQQCNDCNGMGIQDGRGDKCLSCEGRGAHPAQQEPVAWMVYTLDGKSVCVTDNPTDFGDQHKARPLYTTPPRREWVGLTDGEIDPMVFKRFNDGKAAAKAKSLAQAIEAKLREKNA